MQTHSRTTPKQSEPEQPLIHLSGQEDRLFVQWWWWMGGREGEGGGGAQFYIYESYILPKHIGVIYNRYRLAASKTLNINVKRIYDKRNKLYSR